MAVRKACMLRIHLGVIDVEPEPCSAGMGIANLWPSDVDPPHFRVGEKLLVRQGGMTDRATHVEDSPWLEVRQRPGQIVADRPSHVVVQRPCIAHRIQIDPAVIQCADRDIAGLDLGRIAARHAVNVQRGDIARHVELIGDVERGTAFGRKFGGSGVKLGQFAVDRDEHAFPQQFLRNPVRRGIMLEIGVVDHARPDVAAVSRGAVVLALERLRDAPTVDVV